MNAMAAADCVLLRSLVGSRPAAGPSRTQERPQPSQASLVCRDVLRVVAVWRYTRDLGSPVYFPQTVFHGDHLYDVTLTDGDCRVQVTLDPGLNDLVERWLLHPGRAVNTSTFRAAMSAQLPASPGISGDGRSYRLVRVELGEEGDRKEDWDSLPWFGSSPLAEPPVPLRANRSVFLPLWNDVDYCGVAWTKAPPPGDDLDEDEGIRPDVSVTRLRRDFLSGQRQLTRGAVDHQLIVRIINKSHLTYFGKTDQNSQYPYKALLEVCDRTGSVSVVLWNSVCVRWFCHLKPGDIISLRRYRVKTRYPAQSDDIEISVNSRNPTGLISVLPESSVSPPYLPDPPTYTFCNSQEVPNQPHGAVCDVIGLLVFSGRSERTRSQDGGGAGLREYRWLQLEDGASDQPITVKLFSTSQPEVHRQLQPMSVVVCSRLKVIHCPPAYFLTNTTFTQVYVSGHHSQMAYKRLHPVQSFLRWLRFQDERQVLSRALIGGFFMFPPPPVSLVAYLRSRQGDPGFLRGAELKRAMRQLCYRERRTFCIQAMVTMVTCSSIGEDDCRRSWTDRTSSATPSHPPRPTSRPTSSLSSGCRAPPSSAPNARTPSTSEPRTTKKKKVLSTAEDPRCPWSTLQQYNSGTALFDASLEFLCQIDEEDKRDDGHTSSFVTAPTVPTIQPVAMETLPMHIDPIHREEQVVSMAIGGGRVSNVNFVPAVKNHYTVRLKALPDGVLIDTVFLPHSSSLCHSNTWTSILSHGAFSSDSPPPSSADLITTASQLANQRLVCVLEACHLGGARTELILTRAFCLD